MMLISPQQISGLILAGGRGRRVAEQDKGLLCLNGKPMIEHQLSWFSSQVDQIIISANRNIDQYRTYGWPVLKDTRGNLQQDYSGPLEGVYHGLQESACEWLFVQPVDMPLMPQDVILRLCQKIKEQRQAYFLKSSQREHYLSMLISKKALPKLEQYLQGGNKRVRDFLKSINAEAIDLNIDEKYFTNLNLLADYSD